MLTLGIHLPVQHILRLSTAICWEPSTPLQLIRALSVCTLSHAILPLAPPHGTTCVLEGLQICILIWYQLLAIELWHPYIISVLRLQTASHRHLKVFLNIIQERKKFVYIMFVRPWWLFMIFRGLSLSRKVVTAVISTTCIFRNQKLRTRMAAVAELWVIPRGLQECPAHMGGHGWDICCRCIRPFTQLPLPQGFPLPTLLHVMICAHLQKPSNRNIKLIVRWEICNLHTSLQNYNPQISVNTGSMD